MSNSDDQPKCPVDPSTRNSWSLLFWAKKSPETTTTNETKAITNEVDSQPACPVDHKTRADWLSKVSVSADVNTEAVELSQDDMSCTSDKLNNHPTSASNVELPTDRVISSIPRTSSGNNWIYPSEKQFFDAMTRKNWNPESSDMKTVVPIHNLVNERTWNHIMNWEQANQEEATKKCGGIKLTSFQGNPNKLTPRAWFRSYVFGMDKPFDRHDWIVDRCGTEVEYVIDFYSGQEDGNVFLDVRPKLNNWEGIKLRFNRAVGWS